MPFSKFLFLGCFFPPSPIFFPFLYISNYKTRSFYFSLCRSVQSTLGVADSVGGTPPSPSARRRWQPWRDKEGFCLPKGATSHERCETCFFQLVCSPSIPEHPL